MMHAGGWDEILLVAGPLAIIAALIVVARKRVPPEDDADHDRDRDRPAG